jgi:hypothetical protein
MLERWYKLAERYVIAVEETATETARIAMAQERSHELLAQSAATQERIAETQARAVDRPLPEHRFELPELGPLVEGIAELARMLSALKGNLPGLSEGDPK